MKKHSNPAACAATLALAASALSASAQAPAAAPTTEKKGWDSSAQLGMTLTSGNSETLTISGGVAGNRKWDRDEVALGLEGMYGKDHSTVNAESLRGFGQYTRLLTERLGLYGRAEAMHDGVADVDYRVTLSPGASYYIVKNETTFLRGEAGPGWVYEKKGGSTQDYFTVRLAERFEHKFNDRVKLWEALEYLPRVDKWEQYLVNAELGLATSLSKALTLKTYLLDTYDSKPAPGRKNNDLKFVAAVAYTF